MISLFFLALGVVRIRRERTLKISMLYILRYMKVHSQDPTWRHFQAISIWSSPYVTSLNYHKGSTANLKSHEFPCSLLNFQNFYYWKQLNVKLLSARSRNSRPEVFCKKAFLKIAQNSQKSTCARVPFLIKLLASASCIFCEFCETFKNTYFYRTPAVAASEDLLPHQMEWSLQTHFWRFVEIHEIWKLWSSSMDNLNQFR